jgi:hypothetical protein
MTQSTQITQSEKQSIEKVSEYLADDSDVLSNLFDSLFRAKAVMIEMLNRDESHRVNLEVSPVEIR